jgi:redox-sensitive bicupin YhaK (pirin superfamily)
VIAVRKSDQRGVTNFGWLDSRHTFSFGDYHDPSQMGFRALRVINDDRVAAGAGFPRHGHRDMEILTWVLDGGLAHRDSLGSGSVLRPGDLQKMSAGTGILHSEFNASETDPVRFLQIWIVPERPGLPAAYEQKHFDEAGRRGRWQRVAGRAPLADGALPIHQDVDLHVASLDAGQAVEHVLAPGRHAWIQVALGSVEVNGIALDEGDGAAASGESRIAVRATRTSEILLFDLA